MSTTDLLAGVAVIGLITGICWRYMFGMANKVRRGDYRDDELDDAVEVSGF